MHAKLNHRYMYLNESERFLDSSCESKRKDCHSRIKLGFKILFNLLYQEK